LELAVRESCYDKSELLRLLREFSNIKIGDQVPMFALPCNLLARLIMQEVVPFEQLAPYLPVNQYFAEVFSRLGIGYTMRIRKLMSKTSIIKEVTLYELSSSKDNTHINVANFLTDCEFPTGVLFAVIFDQDFPNWLLSMLVPKLVNCGLIGLKIDEITTLVVFSNLSFAVGEVITIA
jgi:hypothetical protein